MPEDKVVGSIDEGPTRQEIADILHKREAKQERLQESLQQAAAKLKKLVETKEVQRIGWAVQFGYRLIQWAQMEAASIPNMDELTLLMLMQAQEQAVQTGFDFEKVVADFKKNQLPWIAERMREAKVVRNRRERRIKALSGKLRRKDIPLPVHSLRTLFDEKGFTHEDSLMLLGPGVAVSSVARLIAVEYQKAGGTVLFLSEHREPETKRVAKLSVPPLGWLNCCRIFTDVVETLDTFVKKPKGLPGLLVVEHLDNALSETELGADRPERLQRAFANLKQYQQERGIALLVAIHTDDDPVETDPMQIYPPLLLSCPFVQVKIEQSQLVDGAENVVIGNDVMTMSELQQKVKGDKDA